MTDDRRPTTLIELVRHYSPSGEESAVVEYLVGRMDELSFTRAYSDGVGNAIGVMGDGPRQVVLLGHIDTVPGEIPVRITPSPRPDGHPPSPLLGGDGKGGWGGRGEVLYGRGAVDAKGPLAAFADAVAAVGPLDGWQFVVIGAVDEEQNSTGARHILDQYRPDFAIIGEPSQWNRVTLGYKGSAWAEVTVTLPVEHTAAQGQSAPEAAIDLWNHVRAAVDEFNIERERVFDQLLLTLRSFASETDHFQDSATLTVGVRLPLDVSPDEWYERLIQTSESFKNSEVSCTITPTGFSIPAYKAERNTPLVRAFLGAIRAAGGRPGFVVKTGTADLNIVAPIWDCPAVAYGPGDSSLDHTPHERLSLVEYRNAVNVLTNVLKTLSRSNS
ncbi:MAG: [LysW]-lysine hydrolase [Chloroflexi bacterium]|jgi:[amino group carrier protein]-lysine/ornithine hydrolase|nr:[LysW]-lysine hydrolase [Chloroflexota bacterium]